MNNKLLSLFITAFLILPIWMNHVTEAAHALPIMDSKYDQSFLENQSGSYLRNIFITEDDTQNFFTVEEGIRITIPDSLPIIFDVVRMTNQFSVSGASVDQDRLDQLPAISFEDKDKTLVIPLRSTLNLAETIELRQVFIKGFNWRSDTSDSLRLTYMPDQPVVIKDARWINIKTSSNTDRVRPLEPTDLRIVQLSRTSLHLSWTNPTDLDVQRIVIYRSTNGNALSEYKEVTKTIEAFVDLGLIPGDTYNYELKADDGLSLGEVSEKVSLTIDPDFVVPIEPESVVEPDPVPEPPADPLDITNLEEVFDDVMTEDDAADAIRYLYDNDVIKGRSLGEFAPEGTALRSEFAKMVAISFDLPIPESLSSFPDVVAGSWYEPYIAAVFAAGVMTGDRGLASPDREISRAEAVAMVIRAAEYPSGELSALATVPYRDVNTGEWYFTVIQKALILEALDWVKNSLKFFPSRSINRAELSQLIYGVVGD